MRNAYRVIVMIYKGLNKFTIFSGHQHVLEYLLEVDCSPNIVDMYDQAPLHVAVMSGHLNCVRLLIEGKSFFPSHSLPGKVMSILFNSESKFKCKTLYQGLH